MLKTNEAIEVKVLLLDDDGIPTSGTIAYTVYDEGDVQFSTGNMTVVTGVTGLYTMSFTPDAAGEWTVRLICTSPTRYAAKVFSVGKGVEQATYNAIVTLDTVLDTHDTDIKTLLAAAIADLNSPNQYKADVSALALEATLATHDTDIKTLLTAVQADLDNPNQYKANVSSLALEATLTAIKGGSWTIETLKAIYDAIAALNDLAQSDILSDATPFAGAVIGAVDDTIDIGGTLTAKHQAIFANIHICVGLVVADKDSLTANETAMETALEKRFDVCILDDDDIDNGDADLEMYGLIVIGTSVTDMTKINELTTVSVPVFTRSAEAALTILRMGDDSGGANTSWGENAAETQINITNITHQITIMQSLGNLLVYSSAGRVQWVRKTDLVAGTVQLAEIAGDNTKNSIVVLPYDVPDEDGTSAPAIRAFVGLRDFTLFTAAVAGIFNGSLDWVTHQGKREVVIEGLGKINQVKALLEDGTYGLAALETLVDEVESLLKHGTYGLAALDSELGTLATSSALATHDTDIKALLNHATYGLSAIETLVDGIESSTDNLPTAPADQAKVRQHMDFKSLPLQITLTSTAGDRGLVSVVVSGLPAGITIIAVEGIFYCDSVENTYNGVNYLESTTIQVRELAAGTDRTAITLEANRIFRFTIQMVRGGTVLTADWATATAVGILAEVTGNGTYQMWFDVGETVQNNIVLDGAVFMLRIWFY